MVYTELTISTSETCTTITGNLERTLNLLITQLLQPAKYCEEYPVDTYSLVVEGVGPSGSPQAELFLRENQLIADQLSEDAVYIFKVHAQNSVGKASTKGIEICKFLDVHCI